MFCVLNICPCLHCLTSHTLKRANIKYIKMNVRAGRRDKPKGTTIIIYSFFNKMNCAHMNYRNPLLSLKPSDFIFIRCDPLDNLTNTWKSGNHHCIYKG